MSTAETAGSSIKVCSVQVGWVCVMPMLTGLLGGRNRLERQKPGHSRHNELSGKAVRLGRLATMPGRV
jgi:hypothetical protein